MKKLRVFDLRKTSSPGRFPEGPGRFPGRAFGRFFSKKHVFFSAREDSGYPQWEDVGEPIGMFLFGSGRCVLALGLGVRRGSLRSLVEVTLCMCCPY